MNVNELDTNQALILFDGLCNLCSASVQFIIKRDKKNVFKFASLQSELGQSILSQFHLSTSELNSFILYKSGKVYTRSTGALLVTKHLSGAWPLLSSLMIVPPFIRNGVYNIISRNRYKWFGKKNACWLPTPALKAKFLDN
jgi:predicted DCC family thiol-disulfide oxidoreductase YuxK